MILPSILDFPNLLKLSSALPVTFPERHHLYSMTFQASTSQKFAYHHFHSVNPWTDTGRLLLIIHGDHLSRSSTCGSKPLPRWFFIYSKPTALTFRLEVLYPRSE